MKNCLTLFFALAAATLCPSAANAFDFTDGVLCYTVISETDLTCKVDRPQADELSYPDNLVIPETVSNGTKTYKVVAIGSNSILGASCTSISIPNSVNTIEGLAMAWCPNITELVIPNSVTEIGNAAFRACRALVSVKLPDSITEIAPSLFYDCAKLPSIDIPESVTKIGDMAFCRCSALASVKMPESVSEIGSEAFLGCSSLTSAPIPPSSTTIAPGAFYNCKNITSVVIPETVTEIGDNAFCNCTNLSSVEFAKAGSDARSENTEIARIGDCAFYKSGLTSIQLPNSVTEIGEGAFYETPLESIEIPGSVNILGHNAFGLCAGIKSLKFADSDTPLGMPYVTLNSEGNAINIAAFSYATPDEIYFGRPLICASESKDLCESVLGTSANQWFLYCTTPLIENDSYTGMGYSFEPKKITISVKDIPADVLAFLPATPTLTLTNKVETIADEALKRLKDLTEINVENPVPPVLGTGSFTEEQYRTIKVNIPDGTLAAYQSADEWKKFLNISGIDDAIAQPAPALQDIFNLQGVCLKRAATQADIDALSPGLYIISGKKILIK